MRKWLIWPMVFFVMGGVFSTALARPIGVGAFAGLNMPIVQEDAGNGPLYGARLRIVMTSFLALEPTLSYLKQGDITVEVGQQEEELDGGHSTALGVNLIVGSVGPPEGLRVFGILGLASHALKQEGTEDSDRFAMSLGPGLEVGVSDKLTLNIEARLHMISMEGGGARKNLGLSGGLTFYLSN